MAEIVMPRLSDTMEEGTILRWLKRDGEEVSRGEELVEIETDKATMSYEADQSGVLETVAGEGDTLAVGALIARIGDATPPARDDGDRSPTAQPPQPPPRDDDQAGGRASASGAANGGAPAAAAPGGQRVRASPLARRLAHERGVDLLALSGSGPGGRIVKADVQAASGEGADGRGEARDEATASRAAGEAAAGRTAGEAAPGRAAGGPAPSQAAPGPAPGAALEGVTTAKGQATVVELSRSQQTIARRMAESRATIPDFTLRSEVDMDRCVQLRSELKRLSGSEAPTYNDMVVKASALALREHPRANCSYRDGALALHARVNVGVAVAVDAPPSEPAGGGALIVPTVFDADAKSLGEIARETRALAARVRDGSITPPELGGGTFTVSNLGMFGVSSFSAIINPPQVAILAVGSVEQRAVVRDGEIVARHMLSLTLTCDHRVLYGADAAKFLSRIGELVGEPAALTL